MEQIIIGGRMYSENVAQLLLFAENNPALAQKRDEILAAHWISVLCKEKRRKIDEFFIEEYLPLVENSYRELTKNSVHLTDVERLEFGGHFYGEYQNWWRDNHLLNTLPTLESYNKITSGAEDAYPNNLVAKLSASGNRLSLPTDIRFSPKEYADVKNVILKAGGTYKKNGFDFEEPAQAVLDRILGGGKYNLKKEFQFFATPDELADQMASLALEGRFDGKDSILEPSAGRGALVHAIHRIAPHMNVWGYEAMPTNRPYLEAIEGFFMLGEDFLNATENVGYDVIIANPPFRLNQDIDHIRKMYDVCGAGGRIVTLSSRHWEAAKGKKEAAFRADLKRWKAKVIPVAPGTFRESGTDVATNIIVINRP